MISEKDLVTLSPKLSEEPFPKLQSSFRNKQVAIANMGGSPQAKRKAHRRWSVLPGGLGSAYWMHRRSARDGGEYAGRGFGGFAS